MNSEKTAETLLEKEKDMEKLRVGVIGIGFIGAAHVEALRRLGYVDVVAVAAACGGAAKADGLYGSRGDDDSR